MIELKQHARLAQHFRSAHIFTWPVDLTRIHKVTPRGTVRHHRPDQYNFAKFGPEIAKEEINQIFRVR